MLVVAHGSRTAEIRVTRSLTIHGLKASTPATVSFDETTICGMRRDESRLVNVTAFCSQLFFLGCLSLYANIRFAAASPKSTESLSLPISIKQCPTCAKMKKSGKLSCCARGGAWFKNCGDTNEKDFDHTWAQGIQACNGFARSIFVKSALQPKLHNMGVMAYPVSSAQSRNATQKKMNFYHPVSTLNVTTGTIDSDDIDGVTEVAVLVCVLCTCWFRFI